MQFSVGEGPAVDGVASIIRLIKHQSQHNGNIRPHAIIKIYGIKLTTRKQLGVAFG